MRERRRPRRTWVCRWLVAGAVTASVVMLPGTAGAEAVAGCTAGTGPYQREMERHLRLTVDGRQSASDCTAIRRFQQGNGVRPADGYPGLVTYRMMLVAEARKNPNAAKKCPVRSYRVACVDLTRQLMWVQKGRKVLFGPVPTRTGRDGYETRKGWHRIYWRSRDHHSDIYNNAPMPFSQFFNGGQAFHGTYNDLFKGGSHGCVNLRYADAKRLWSVLRLDDAVYTWGVKPGTWRSMPPSSDVTGGVPPAGDPPPAIHTPPPQFGVG